MAALGGFLNRIPPSMWALFLIAAGVWLYVRYLDEPSHRRVLLDILGNFILIDIIVTRLSIFVLYPSSILHLTIWTFLSEPPASGWMLGGVAGWGYVWYALRRSHLLIRPVLRSLLMGILFGGLLYFVYEWWISFPPFRLQAAIRWVLDGLLVVWLWLWREHKWSLRYPERLLGVIGSLLLATSVMVPQLGKIGPLSPAQWVYLFLIFIALAFEARRDLVTRSATKPEDS